MTLKEIKDYIVARIFPNSSQKISGEVMQDTLTTMADAMTTPSGDPMHYAYESAGAIWNANSGYWELNTLTDITQDEMRTIYQEAWTHSSLINVCAWFWVKGRTNINKMDAGTSLTYLSNVCCFGNNIEVFVLSNYASQVTASTVTASFRSCEKLRKIIGTLSFQYTNSFSSAYMFKALPKLEEVTLKHLKHSISFAESPNLSKESILYMISNSAATSTITITLHATAYAMANADADIKSALASKTYVKLASA